MRVLATRMVRGAGDAEAKLLEIPGLGTLRVTCYAQSATARWYNLTADPIDAWLPKWVADGLGSHNIAGSSGRVVAPRVGWVVIDDQTPSDGADAATIALGKGDNPPSPRTTATVHVSAHQSGDGQPCGFQAQATLWTG